MGPDDKGGICCCNQSVVSCNSEFRLSAIYLSILGALLEFSSSRRICQLPTAFNSRTPVSTEYYRYHFSRY